MFKIAFVLGSLFIAIHSLSQPAEKVIPIPKTAADCSGAIKIVDEYGPVINTVGFGTMAEASDRYELIPFLHKGEYHPVWFRFTAESSGELELIIKSVNPQDDYNFLLYSSPGPWFCNVFKNELVNEPLRANRSSADQGIGLTGVNKAGTEERAAIDAPSAFCKSLSVNRGDAFYLFVDSEIREQSGFKVILSIKSSSGQ